MFIIQNLPNFMLLQLILQAMFMQQLKRWTYQVDIPGRWASMGEKNTLHPIIEVHVATK
jgi:hypothetical protein